MVFRSSVFFSGHVQGVGFRQQVFSIAKGFECTGWVKNLEDGRVQLYLEGEREDVRAFIDTVADELDVYIRSSEESSSTGDRLNQAFAIVP